MSLRPTKVLTTPHFCPSLSSPSTSKPSYTSHQLESAPFRAVHGVTSFPVQLSFPITPSFPHYTSPRHELTSTVTEQICFATSCAGKVPSRNQYNPGSYLKTSKTNISILWESKGTGKGADGERLNQSGIQENVFVDFQPWIYSSFKVREKIKIRQSLFIPPMKEEKVEPALPI